MHERSGSSPWISFNIILMNFSGFEGFLLFFTSVFVAVSSFFRLFFQSAVSLLCVLQARILFFRKLKTLLKKFAGKHSFHNFATGGAVPEESAAVRKLDRMYHKDLLVSEGA